MKISIVNYGCGNIGSVVNMLKHIGVGTEVISTPDEVRIADKIILPGVGKWDAGASSLMNSGVLVALEERVLVDKIPFLGICLGMQLLLSASEEGNLPGLGWISGKVKSFSFPKPANGDRRLAVPHMGWNSVTVQQNSTLTESLTANSKFYFVHSYYAVPDNSENIIIQANYGHDFTCGIRKENIYGLQFHPEKSHKHGMDIMKSFSSI
ncbi:imidazole glycerol phosphate synthase subunit HisH [Pseudomonadales bacterium]|nr:imidazole glycerol phosphate synthase subunit HisH [Pseudomonadales bacterium]